jgi:hypothetical protein
MRKKPYRRKGWINMRTSKQKRRLIPPWEMPSDPVKGLFWFMYWLLRVLVRFFWVVILIGAIYETIRNGMIGGVGGGIIAGIVTFLVGLGVWAGLAVVLFLLTIGRGVSQTLGQFSRMQQSFPPRQSFYRFEEPEKEADDRIVEGTIITDLDEERKKRRSE